VKSGSPAAQKGLRAGDVIVEAGQDKVSAPNQIQAKIEEARKAGRKSVLLLVVRKADKRFIVLRVDEG
jgi:serine protease Do